MILVLPKATVTIPAGATPGKPAHITPIFRIAAVLANNNFFLLGLFWHGSLFFLPAIKRAPTRRRFCRYLAFSAPGNDPVRQALGFCLWVHTIKLIPTVSYDLLFHMLASLTNCLFFARFSHGVLSFLVNSQNGFRLISSHNLGRPRIHPDQKFLLIPAGYKPHPASASGVCKRAI